ncbi:alpha/beta hydrolase [Hymenobacter amundsenii]|uniref:Alpha/beta hydrolase n=1 Tax=Hymenobacter amundsenii TaxID=2006685 RepID=A0A246FMA9_9BACT|nr:alpha/beta hydrolase [Hymenobacter amundsenii]
MVMLYPTATAGRPTMVGLYELPVAPMAAAAAGAFPLVVISHGTGGSGLTHRLLAHYLARHGCVVALPEHPHNHRADNSWANTPQNLLARPRHLRLVIDFLLAAGWLEGAVKTKGVALIGHSLGGYSALALAGGRAQSLPPAGMADGGQPLPVISDARVRALVLLAPAVSWFQAEGALQNVTVPILLLAAEHDVQTPPAFHAALLRRHLPNPANLTYRLVANAGHFSFLSPFPAARISPALPPSQDPPGFDRAQFQAELGPEVLAFLRRVLG